MTDITETAQDATGLEGVVKIDELPWIDIGVGDNAIKVLRVCPETQQHTVLIRAPAGQVNQRHIHSGPADFYVIEGEIGFEQNLGADRHLCGYDRIQALVHIHLIQWSELLGVYDFFEFIVLSLGEYLSIIQ